MSLDEHMQLTDEQKEFIDERFLELVEKRDYKGAKKFHDRLNDEAQKYLETHDKHAWDLLITKTHYENHKR